MGDLVNSLQFGIPSAVIVLIFLIISKIIDSVNERHKDKTKIEINKEIIDCFNNLNLFLQHITKDIIEKNNDKCIHTIRTSFRAFSNSIIKYSINCIINNNIEINKQNIIDGLDHLINYEFTLLHNNLYLYTNNEKPISNYIKSEWKEEIKLDVINVIFNISLSKEQKISTLINKISIRIKDYSSEVKKQYIEYGQSDYLYITK